MVFSKLITVIPEEEILFTYTGMISQDFVNDIDDIIEDTLKKHKNSEDFDTTIFGNMFAIAIEKLQNIMSYSKNVTKKDQFTFLSEGVCLLGFNTKLQKYFIRTINHIQKDHKEKIIIKIDAVNSMERKELRKKVRELLKSGENSHDRGAGVGFLEIAKKSSEKLVYNFIEDKDEDYFILTTFI